MPEWTRSALADLHATLTFLGADDRKTAGDVARRIRNTATRLDDFPEIGRPGRAPGTRELSVPRLPFVLVYAPGQSSVVILRLLHTSRIWPPPASQPER